MSIKKIYIHNDSYHDSVSLMLLSKELKGTAGVHDAMVVMGTAMNLDLLRSLGFEEAAATPNDLVIAVDCEDEETARKVADTALGAFARRRNAPEGIEPPRSLREALEQCPDANLAMISLPGGYAAREARKALAMGLHVMLFSDNIPLDEEIALKDLSRRKGLLLMGPDCGTSIINGNPICFANAVRRGPVGIVGASGTGIQEVTCLIDRAGSGISQAIGTGGRDLKDPRVGGSSMFLGISALAADPLTTVIVVISKPPASALAEQVVRVLEGTRKPAVVHFIGMETCSLSTQGPVHFAENLEATALRAVELAGGVLPVPGGLPTVMEALLDRECAGIIWPQKYARGYFTGGTLADEAWIVLQRATGAVYSNNQTDPRFLLPDPHRSIGHTVVDLGDDAFTVGRPHPMIDPSTRTERILAEVDDPEIAVLLVDVVLGYGSHPDPAGAMIPALTKAREAARARRGYLPVVASITGTLGDSQGYARQKATLESIGCIVLPSNHQAAVFAGKLLERLRTRAGRSVAP